MTYLLIFLLIAGTVGAQDIVTRRIGDTYVIGHKDSLRESYIRNDSLFLGRDTTRWYVERVDTLWSIARCYTSNDSAYIVRDIATIDTIWAEKVQKWFTPEDASIVDQIIHWWKHMDEATW